MNSGKGMLYVAAAFALAGSSVIAARHVSVFLPPFAVTFVGLFFAVVTATLVRGRATVAALPGIGRARWLLLLLQALFGIVLFRVFLTFGLLHTSSAEAGIVTGTAPAITGVLAALLLREPLSRRGIAGIAVTLLGVLVMQGFPLVPLAAGHLLGNFLALCATACEALFAVIARKMHRAGGDGEEPLHPVSHAGIVSAIALLLCLFPMVIEGGIGGLSGVPASGWAALAWYGAVITVVAFACMFAGTRLCDGYAIAALTGVLPLSSLVLSIMILGDRVSAHQWAGCGLIVLAVLATAARRDTGMAAVVNRPAGTDRS